MSRSVRVLLLSSASIAVVALLAACGTERISVPTSQVQLHRGAVLFSQRCSGCHTLSYAATHGSAANPRTATAISGPDFNVRCERPIDRVMYAIINGGFSGAYMPQNVVTGQDAIDVARFVATYAGRASPREPGTQPCDTKPVGTLPPSFHLPTATAASASVKPPSSATVTAAGASPKSTAVASVSSGKHQGAAKKTAHS
jgi:cytochrome c551